MAYQPIGLGTPNNNDGDSLYAGGIKINANFAELYVALAGSSAAAIKIALGSTAPGTSTTLIWSSSQQRFVASSSDAIRTTGANGETVEYVTNDAGVSGGTNSNLVGAPNAQYLFINGRQIWSTRARTTGSTANTRAEIHFGMGLNAVTAASVYTTGAVVRGANGLTVFANTAEDNAASSLLLLSATSGLTLFQTPKLDFSTMSTAVRDGSDSSNAVAHTGFVKVLLGRYPVSSTPVLARRGLISTGSDLSTSNTMVIDGVYHPKHMEGLIYNYNTLNNVVTLVTGAAAHWSYNTSGVASVIGTTSIAMVASYTPILRTFTAGWTPDYNDAGSTPAVIDATVTPNTWYYMYYIGCLQQYVSAGGRTFYPGSSNVVTSSNRDIASVDAQLRAGGFGPAGPNGYWQVVRRLGPVRTDGQASPRLVPFNVKRIDHGAFEYYWGLNGGAGSVTAAQNAPGGFDSSFTTSLPIPPIYLNSIALTAGPGTSSYTSALLTQIPPIPGVTAFLTVKHRPSAAIPYVYMYSESWTANSSISALYPPFEVFRSTTSGVTNLHQIQMPMSPDGCYIPDGLYNGAGNLAVLGATGQTIRYAMIAGETSTGVISTGPYLVSSGSSLGISVTVTGFRYAR